jgi:hypothetical protein
MMRNVAIGAVLGFGVVVLLLSVFNQEPPPLHTGPAVLDAGVAQTLQPVNTAPVMKMPLMARDPAARQMLMERFQQMQQQRVELAPADAGS